MITQEELKRLLHYDPYTGIFTWKVILRYSKKKVGDIVGWPSSEYLHVDIYKKRYKLHRLAFLYIEGKLPENDVDHIDGNRINNKWDNLRKATRGQNNANVFKSNVSSSGYKGVSYFKGRKKSWRVQININSINTHIGYYYTPEEAAMAYDEKAKEVFGEFAWLNFKDKK